MWSLLNLSRARVRDEAVNLTNCPLFQETTSFQHVICSHVVSSL